MARFKNLQELFLSAGARWGPKVALRHIAGGRVREIKYRDLASLSFQFAQYLWQRGLRPGDRLALAADNCPEWVLTCLAAFRLGAIVVPLDARSRAGEILPVCDRVEPKLVILGNRQYVQVANRLPSERLITFEQLLYSEKTGAHPHLGSQSPTDPALIIFTSGTSGAAKGVVLTHGNILANVMSVAQAFNVTTGDRLLSVLPLSHMLEFTAGLAGPLHKGATVVYAQPRGPKHLEELLKVEKISVLLGTPLVFQSLLHEIESEIEELPRADRIKMNLCRRLTEKRPNLGPLLFRNLHKQLGGSIKFWLAGGAPTPPEVVTGLKSLGITLLTGYGLSEASPIVSANTGKNNKPDSVGQPVAGVQVKVVDPDQSGSGEILVHGANVMSRYWNNPEETKRALEDGWLHTGDSGYLDDSGHLHVTGRIKSMVVTAGGYNLYPEELEQTLSKSELIKEICVFGRSGPSGEEVCAAIVPSKPVGVKSDHEDALRQDVARLLAELADYKRLASYQVWDKGLPRTPTGKIRRGEVARLFELRQKKKGARKASEEAAGWDEIGLAVCRTVAEVMDPDLLQGICPSGSRDFPPDTRLAGDLGLDSFSRLELACRFEQEFSRSVPEDALQEAQTVEDLVVLVKSPPVSPDQSRQRQQLDREQAETSPSSANALLQSRSWPFPFSNRLDWPLKDDPLIVNGRKILDIALRTFLKIYNQFETSGQDRLLIDPPYIVAANHASHFDTLALLASFPPNLLKFVHPVAAVDYFFPDFIRSALSTYLLNAVPFDRFGGFEESLRSCESLLRDGRILIIFPEGSRSITGTLGKFRPGVARLSITAHCPIIPAYIEGSQAVLPKGKLIPSPEQLKIRFGLPLYPPGAEPTLRSCQDFAARLQAAVASLKGHDKATHQPSASAGE